MCKNRTHLLLQSWSRPLSNGHCAIAALSTRTDGTPYPHTFTLADVGISKASAYSLYDLYQKKNIGKFTPKDSITIYVVPNGIRMIRAVPVTVEVVEKIKVDVLDFML